MQTQNSAFATSLVSASAEQARTKVVRLFRVAMRESENILKLYQLDFTRSEIRAKIKQEFLKHAGVRDLAVIDMLVFKGTTELEEAKKLWKTKSHVVRFFVPERAGRSQAEMKKIQAKLEKDWAEQQKIEAKSSSPQSKLPPDFYNMDGSL